MLWKQILLLLGLFNIVPAARNLRRNLPATIQWSVKDNQVFMEDQPVNLKGITWNGLNSDTLSFFGLWKHSLEFYMDQLKNQNFNAILVPFSAEWSYYHRNTKPFHSTISNDFECINKTSIQILDLFFEKTRRKNLMVVLNLNRLHKDFMTDVWIDEPEYPINVFYNSWFNLLDIYHESKNLLGIDIFGEPFGRANFNLNNTFNWANFAEEFLDAIHTRYPSNSWLFFIEGIEYGTSFKNNIFDFNGKPYANRIVYTPHVYDDQFPDAYTKKTSVDELYLQWNNNFGFLVNQNKSVLITNCKSRSNIWLNFFSTYVSQKNLANIFLWEVNNDPTNGIFYDDWQTFDDSKLSIINSIQSNATHFYINAL